MTTVPAAPLWTTTETRPYPYYLECDEDMPSERVAELAEAFKAWMDDPASRALVLGPGMHLRSTEPVGVLSPPTELETRRDWLPVVAAFLGSLAGAFGAALLVLS